MDESLSTSNNFSRPSINQPTSPAVNLLRAAPIRPQTHNRAIDIRDTPKVTKRARPQIVAMGKKRTHASVEDILERPWCYYC